MTMSASTKQLHIRQRFLILLQIEILIKLLIPPPLASHVGDVDMK